MKTVTKFAVLLSLAALAPFAASAKTPEQAYLESCRKDAGVPVPISVVTPTVAEGYAGASVEVEFIVDATGLPTAIAVKSSPDSTLAAAVVDAVKEWRFKPALRDGSPVATKVVLPVRIVDDTLAGSRYAMK
jgi:periplasmic protein TonB